MICFAGLELDEARRELRRDGELIELEPKAFDLLVYLFRHRDRVVSREELLDALWSNASVYEASLTSCLSRLRHALNDRGRMIRTQYGKGYRFFGTEPADRLNGVWRQGARSARDRPKFVGREAELERLRATFEEACLGRGSLVLLGGAQGIGKTRLADELAGAAQSRACVLVGRCPEGTGAPPLWPWTQILRRYADLTDVETLRSEMGSAAPDLVALVPELRAALPGVAPLGTGDVDRQLHALTRLLQRGSRRRPLLLILDDIHGADRASLRALRRLTRSLGELAALVVATYREPLADDNPCLREFLPSLRAAPGCDSLFLAGLDRPAVAHLIESITGSPVGSAVAERIAEETDGNPFFVEQVVLELSERGDLAGEDALAHSDVDVPGALKLLHQERILRLSEPCRRLLAIAAVVGPRFDLRLIHLVLATHRGRSRKRSVSETQFHLEQAVRAGVIRPSAADPGDYRFAHAFLRETVLDGLSPGDRATLHCQVAQAMDDPCGAGSFTPSESAEQWIRGVAVAGPAKAIAAAARAGEAAESAFAFAEAAPWYEKALSLLTLAPEIDHGERLRLLIRLARAQSKAGMLQASAETAGQAAHVARRLRDARSLAQAALARELSTAQGLVDVEYVRTLEEADAGLGPGDGDLKPRVLARLAWAHYFSRDRGAKRDALAQQAIDLARRLADPATLLWTLCEVHAALTGPDHSSARLSLADEIIRSAGELGERESLALGHASRARDLAERGQIEAADLDMAACGRIADEINHPMCRWRCALWRALRALLAGRWNDAQELARSSFAIGSRIDPEVAVFNAANLSLTMQGLLGRLDGLDGQLQALLSDYPLLQLPRAALAYILAQQNRIDQAVQVAEQVLASGADQLFWDSTALTTLGFVSLVYAEVRDRRRCSELYDVLAPYQDLSGVLGVNATVWYGPVAWPLAALAESLGRRRAADAHFQRAIAICRGMGARPWLAQICVDQARALKRRGVPSERTRASELLRAADALARELSMDALRARIAALA